ncbi:CYTH and CHAD domain-containing protein [Ideonella sp. DXS22W]|uniref:CYTH and CHAD domain-containing protein n=1 Tax=Pseudaquabacterium inlustre TaxID=2984192 RepID=A0ABU9CNN8_9BURK
MTHEVELKFRIPAHRLAALRRAVATRSARPLTLAARYMETPDGDLGRARVALRLRQEGDGWVQTLKAEGRVALQRLEHNVPLPDEATPALDIARHDGTEAGARLREVLAGARQATLREHYATAVQRTCRTVRHQGALIELALDEGEIRAGGLVLPVCEIEFELLQGEPAALLGLAAAWARRFELWLDVRSKSERGHALAHQAQQPGGSAAQAISRPARPRALTLPGTLGPQAAAAAMLAEGLQQALANASQIADGQWQPEHLHQLRVGLRRLRSVLRLHAALLPGLEPALADAVAALFQRLGAARDRDVRAAWLWPVLHAAGGPAIAQPEPQVDALDLPAWLTSADTQQLWLRLLALTLPGAVLSAGAEARAAGQGTAKALRQALRPPLHSLLRQLRRDARAFATLDDAARHRLRRRIKRLRYAAELSASLWPARRLQALLDALQQAQRPLGVLNDAVVAAAHCRALAGGQPEAWFAVGWLAARHEAAVAACSAPMAALAEVRSPWAD